MAEKKGTLVSGRGLDPTGRFNMKYNPAKRGFRRALRNYFIPSLITAGVAVGAFLAFPVFSTALSLTVLNATLVGAGTFATTAALFGTGGWVAGKLRARSRVKKALRKGADAQARLFDIMQPQTLRDERGRYHSAARPIRGAGFTRRSDLIMSYLKHNKNASGGARFTNIELAQRIIDGDDTRYLADLLVKGAKRGYFGSEAKAYAKNSANRRALKNIKYMTEADADALLSNMFGVENHFKTEGVDRYTATPAKSIKNPRSSQKTASVGSAETTGSFSDDLDKIYNTSEGKTEEQIEQEIMNAIEKQVEKRVGNAGLQGSTDDKSGHVEDSAALIAQMTRNADEAQKSAYASGYRQGSHDEIAKRSSLIKKINETRPYEQPPVYINPMTETVDKSASQVKDVTTDFSPLISSFIDSHTTKSSLPTISESSVTKRSVSAVADKVHATRPTVSKLFNQSATKSESITM